MQRSSENRIKRFQTTFVLGYYPTPPFQIRKYIMNTLNKTLLSVSVALGLNACANVQTAKTYDLDFSKQKYTEQSIEVNGQAVKFRAYENVVYVRNPVDTRYEIINIYVPEAYYSQLKSK